MWWQVALCLLCMSTTYADYPQFPPCPEQNTTCYYELTVETKLVMTLGRDMIAPCEGHLCYASGDLNGTRVSEADLGNISQADGYNKNVRMLIVANGQMPGPAIDVYEDTTLVIKVKNRLMSDSVTMHWHGVRQHNSNLMDGVGFVTQCPIQPGDDFTYQFRVVIAGTDFYHAHTGAQRTKGLFGPLVIRSRTKYPPALRDDPVVDSDYNMVLNDWNHNYGADIAHLKVEASFDEGEPVISYPAADGSVYSPFHWHSGLVNGKGRYYDPKTGRHNNAPLTVYNISRGERVRFRAVGAGTQYPMRVSVDNHDLIMIASDGYRFEDAIVQSVVVNPGERYDFILNGDATPGCYWIRAVSMEVGVNHSAEALLQYEENPLANNNYDDYATNRCFQPWWQNKKTCNSGSGKCRMLNCPFGKAAETADYECVHLHTLTGLEDDSGVDHNEPFFNEYFFNFANVDHLLSINGRHFVNPPISAASQTGELLADYCTAPECNDDIKGCACTNYQNLTYNEHYQFVFTSVGSGIAPAHPVHFHGHGFQVMYQGFPPLNATTGLSDNKFHNDDLVCPNGQSAACNRPRWAPGMKSEIERKFSKRPIIKDTLTVATGGYAVVRFKANNPGFWYMHCHVELHNIRGMAMMFNEAPAHRDELADIPYIDSFPQCRNYPTEIPGEEKTDSNPPVNVVPSHGAELKLLSSLFVVAIVITLLLVMLLLAVCRRTTDYMPLSTSDKLSM